MCDSAHLARMSGAIEVVDGDARGGSNDGIDL